MTNTPRTTEDIVKQIFADANIHMDRSALTLKEAVGVKDGMIKALDTERTARLEAERRFEKGVKDLDAQLAIQEDEPSTETDPYMCGLLNGMLLAKVDLVGGEYKPRSHVNEKVIALEAQLTTLQKERDEALAELRKAGEALTKLSEESTYYFEEELEGAMNSWKSFAKESITPLMKKVLSDES
jgi:hypothetical protein